MSRAAGQTIEGACHCGSVRWRYEGTPESATACSCTVCRRWGALWAYGFRGEAFHVSGETRKYLRDPKTIEFHFCPVCGCVAYWCTPEAGDDGRYYGAVNLRLAEPQVVAEIPINHFDGLDSRQSFDRPAGCIADIWF